MSLVDRINQDFTYHAPRNQDEIQWYQTIRNHAKAIALLIDTLVPDGREKSTAITKLEEAVFWANAGIARSAPAPVQPEPRDIEHRSWADMPRLER